MNDGSRVNVDQPVADIGVSKDTSGDKQPEQVIYQERVGINQAAASSGGNILIEAIPSSLDLPLPDMPMTYR